MYYVPAILPMLYGILRNNNIFNFITIKIMDKRKEPQKLIQLVHKDCKGSLVLVAETNDSNVYVVCKKCEMLFHGNIPIQVSKEFETFQ